MSTEVQTCGATASSCRCEQPAGHEPPHVCVGCTGKWVGTYGEDDFLPVQFPTGQGLLSGFPFTEGLMSSAMALVAGLGQFDPFNPDTWTPEQRICYALGYVMADNGQDPLIEDDAVERPKEAP